MGGDGYIAYPIAPLVARSGILTDKKRIAHLPVSYGNWVRPARLGVWRMGLPLVFAESRSIAHYALLGKTWASFQLDRERV